jgi:diguanylate cyclase (GGDEF)-like protein
MKPGADPRARARTYRLIRFGAFVLLLFQLGIRLVNPDPSVLPDLILFNLAALFAAASAFLSPLFNDRWAVLAMAGGIGIWAIGSALSTSESFYYFHLWRGFSDISYSLFYPLILLALFRSISAERTLRATEVLDVAIIGLGATSALASLLLRPALVNLDGSVFAVFLAILYPIGDIILTVFVLLALCIHEISPRTILFLCGTTLFAVTDLYFLWKSATTGYSFASLVDDGWVLGLILLAEAMWHPQSERAMNPRVMSSATLASVLISSVLLAFAVMNPESFPTFVLIPAFGTLGFAFIRMSIALREAREIKDERELARTDELTGLSNRRPFINALDSLNGTEALLLLLDLDGFKTINDTLGHDAGDELLKQIAIRFRRQIPSGSILARLGGDEFGAIIYGNRTHGLEIAQALQASLAYPAHLGSHSVTMSVSIGAAINDGKPELMRRVDEAMYQSKKAGGGLTLVEL